MQTRNRFSPRFVSLGIAIMLALAGCSHAGSLLPPHPMEEASFTFNGIERNYLLQIPAEAMQEPLPLILALHGGGGTARSICAMPGGLAEGAYRGGYILLCPEGVERHWNDGRGIQTWRAHAEAIDDVGFLVALIDHLADNYSIDPERVFATGISNGGQMSYRLACERSDRFNAIAPVVASMAIELNCAPKEPVSVIVINGTEDPLIPYAGGEIAALRQGLGTVRSTADVMGFWAAHNGCNPAPSSEILPDVDPGDGTRVKHHVFSGCEPPSHVELYEVVGGGHTWPGANQYLPVSMIGRLSHEIHASDLILEFFDQHVSNHR